MSMAALSRDLVLLILQFLREENYGESAHRLERESGIFFDMKYLEDRVGAGDWDELERYILGFTKIDENRFSMKIFFEIRKHKYLEALDIKDQAKAAEILVKDLKFFSTFNGELYKEIAMLLTLDNFRENEQLSGYRDVKSERATLFKELKHLIEENPRIRDKLKFPTLVANRLRQIVNQSLNWQHGSCKSPQVNPEIRTLFTDHVCSQPNGAMSSSIPAFLNALPKNGTFPQMGAHVQYPPQQLGVGTSYGWMHPGVSGSPAALPAPLNGGTHMKRPLTPPSGNHTVDNYFADPENLMKRQRLMGTSDSVHPHQDPVQVHPHQDPVQVHPHQDPVQVHPHQDPAHIGISKKYELPKAVGMTFTEDSSVTTMDFHPVTETLLLVGTNVGDVSLWDTLTKRRLIHSKFKVWDTTGCSTILKASLAKDPLISVNRVAWNPDGTRFGVAFSKHLVHLYAFKTPDYSAVDQIAEIDAHVGGVNDLVFTKPTKMHILTCGDDKTIKVWDAITGAALHTFVGHEAPVYSICQQEKNNVTFLFSNSVDGKIKAWVYDETVSRINITAPGHWCTTMAYTTDGTRLFSCGTSKEGETYLVEWSESEGIIKHSYRGFRKRSVGVVQFDMTRNQFLAAGDGSMIKYWDMDDAKLLLTTDAEGGLPASPCIRFNKSGSLLAVSANDHIVKVLGNADGLQQLHSIFNRTSSASRPAAPEVVEKTPILSPSESSSALVGTSTSIIDQCAPTPLVRLNGDARTSINPQPIIIDDPAEESKPWKFELTKQYQCSSLKLPDNLSPAKVSALVYTSSGDAILALTSDAIHKVWRWPKMDGDTTVKAPMHVIPQLWQPSTGVLMANKTDEKNLEEVVHYFALSKNDSYLVSVSGGPVSLFNRTTFKLMATLMPLSPTATCLAFHPEDNNIIAMGMDDSSIHMYNVRVDEVHKKLTGHRKRITGLAFSVKLNLLISTGADAQICLWKTDAWEKLASKLIQIPAGRSAGPLAATRVRLHNDQVHFLIVHETHLAVYEAKQLECLQQWVPQDGLITNATYSCDGAMIYATCADGNISIFTKDLEWMCQIRPTAYLNAQPSSNIYPVVIAAHPFMPNRFALGLTDGGVQILEPLDSDGSWETAPLPENCGQATGNISSNQRSR